MLSVFPGPGSSSLSPRTHSCTPHTLTDRQAFAHAVPSAGNSVPPLCLQIESEVPPPRCLPEAWELLWTRLPQRSSITLQNYCFLMPVPPAPGSDPALFLAGSPGAQLTLDEYPG